MTITTDSLWVFGGSQTGEVAGPLILGGSTFVIGGGTLILGGGLTVVAGAAGMGAVTFDPVFSGKSSYQIPPFGGGTAPSLGPVIILNSSGVLGSLQNAGQPGQSPGVSVVNSPDDLTKLFGQASQGGTIVPGSTYPGAIAQLPDGSYIGLRNASKSGGPTIDYSNPATGDTWKVNVGGGGGSGG